MAGTTVEAVQRYLRSAMAGVPSALGALGGQSIVAVVAQ